MNISSITILFCAPAEHTHFVEILNGMDDIADSLNFKRTKCWFDVHVTYDSKIKFNAEESSGILKELRKRVDELMISHDINRIDSFN